MSLELSKLQGCEKGYLTVYRKVICGLRMIEPKLVSKICFVCKKNNCLNNLEQIFFSYEAILLRDRDSTPKIDESGSL